ncbi:MAG TPA: wax ester/triacylglycerol synthase family O-acyltransferase [Polyangiaceae bacterium]
MSVRHRLGALDRLFLAAETRESMMHVGGLLQFSPPPEGGRDVLRNLRDEMRAGPIVRPPWNLKLRHPDLLTSPLQAWVVDDRMDLEYHVRRSALPSPGDERELGILVSRLHGSSLDFHRPPWEAHIIEGLEGGRIALYVKVHHALVDGYTGMRLLTRAMSRDPERADTPMFFSTGTEPREREAREAEAPPAIDSLFRAIRDQIGTAKDLTRAIGNLARARRSHDVTLVSPLQAPRSILNQKITRARRFATQQYPVDRLKAVAKAHGCTLNDVVLAICGGALRRFLLEQDALPDQSLTAMIPVNIRPKDDPGGGNAVGAILASLATDVEDPLERLRAIVASTRHAKEQLQGMSRNAILQYSGLLMAPLLFSSFPGSAGRVRPAFNLVVSNVPGPDHPLYFRRWRLDAAYPLSIPFNGYALNVTVESYAGTLGLGFIGCRDAVPHLQRLAVYTGEALDQLSGAVHT